MTLAEYIKANGLTAASVADVLGVTRPHLYMILHDKRRPSLPLAVRICRMTNGLVPCYVWVDGGNHNDRACDRDLRADAASDVLEAASADDGGVDEQFDAVFRATPRDP